MLRGRCPVNTQRERKYLVEAVRHVKACFINSGSGIMDFSEQLKALRPDVFVVNADANTLGKKRLCAQLGIQYVVLQPVTRGHFGVHSTSGLQQTQIPYRIDLAGGWLDQPFVGKLAPGPVLTISIEPTFEFTERSGMATSSRKRAIELWHTELPHGDREKIARILFSYENPPGTTQFSGSQDAIGIVFPALNRLDYVGDYWPDCITSNNDERILEWLQQHLYLVTLGPRQTDYDVLTKTQITAEGAKALAQAADQCWRAILQRDLKVFGRCFRESFRAQVAMFPRMVDDSIRATIARYQAKALGWKLSGAGGGGYLILVSEAVIADAIKIKIRRNEF
jgi:glycerol-3-phosphate cytidylyltransferase-like family protein